MVRRLAAPLKTSPNSTTALYRDTGDMESTFVKSTQEVLQRVADVASELRENFPVPDQGALSGISRVSGYLNLLYHQVSFHSVLKPLTSNTILVYYACYSAVLVHASWDSCQKNRPSDRNSRTHSITSTNLSRIGKENLTNLGISARAKSIRYELESLIICQHKQAF